MAVRLGALGAAAVCMHHPERGGGEGAYLEEGGEGAYLEGRSAYLEGECLPRGERGVRLLTSSGYESSTALTACSDALMNECTHAHSQQGVVHGHLSTLNILLASKPENLLLDGRDFTCKV